MPEMVRREAADKRPARAGAPSPARCTSPAGESPAPVGVGAPGSRPQVEEGDLHARAGRRKPVRRRESCSGEQARGAFVNYEQINGECSGSGEQLCPLALIGDESPDGYFIEGDALAGVSLTSEAQAAIDIFIPLSVGVMCHDVIKKTACY